MPNSISRRYARTALTVAYLSAWPFHVAFADLTQLQFGNQLEQLAAAANQATYNKLLASGCDDRQTAASATCSGSTFKVWENVRELVHTSNQLTGNNGPTLYSLGLDQEGLGFALQWTSAEEFSTQGSMSGGFVNGQLSGLASRITALRNGATGFSYAGLNFDEGVMVANNSLRGASGGGASADQQSGWSKLGGFINGSYTEGNKNATVLEDAFDFDGEDYSGGLDYRINNHWVAGATFGYQHQKINFDSSKSIVSGDVKMNGFSIMPFALYQSDNWYYSVSLGYQQMQFDTNRTISYPSLNPSVAGVYTIARSTSDAHALTAFATSGYSYHFTEKASLEPYVSLDYRRVTVDGFTEKDLYNEGFNFVIGQQTITSLEVVPSLKLQYILTPSFGVFVPFIDAQLHLQQKDNARNIDAQYVGAEQTLDNSTKFVIPTDAQDKSYQVYTVGVSSVLRGASQKGLDTAATGGIQGFVNYRLIRSLDNYRQHTISAGLRYEF